MPVSSQEAVMAALIAFALALAGCQGGDLGGPGEATPQEATPPDTTIVATTSILGDVVANVLGDGGELHVLIPAGVDPHAFEPSAADATRLREAHLVVANGLGLEAGFDDVLHAAEGDGVEVLRIAEHLDPIPFAGGHGHADEDDHADEGDHAGDVDRADDELDAHVWFDPVRMADAVALLGDRLAEVAPQRAEEVRRNAERYRSELLDLHERVAGILDDIPADHRELVTNHDTLGYLAARYDLEVVGTIVPGGTTLGEASSRELSDLVSTIRGAGVRTIFVDTTAPDRLARAINRELGGEVDIVQLHTEALGPEGSGADTYVGLLETNARRIAEGLRPDDA